jgi:hypothetical protein
MDKMFERFYKAAEAIYAADISKVIALWLRP